MIGKRLKYERLRKNINIKELSFRSGLSVAHLSQLENNKSNGSFFSVCVICDTIGIDLNQTRKPLNNYEMDFLENGKWRAGKYDL